MDNPEQTARNYRESERETDCFEAVRFAMTAIVFMIAAGLAVPRPSEKDHAQEQNRIMRMAEKSLISLPAKESGPSASAQSGTESPAAAKANGFAPEKEMHLKYREALRKKERVPARGMQSGRHEGRRLRL